MVASSMTMLLVCIFINCSNYCHLCLNIQRELKEPDYNLDLSNSLDPDQTGRFAKPDLRGLNCLQIREKVELFGLKSRKIN